MNLKWKAKLNPFVTQVPDETEVKLEKRIVKEGAQHFKKSAKVEEKWTENELF